MDLKESFKQELVFLMGPLINNREKFDVNNVLTNVLARLKCRGFSPSLCSAQYPRGQ